MHTSWIQAITLVVWAGWALSSSAALVEIRLVVADEGGRAVETARLNETFYLDAYVRDLRGVANGGVFAAYLDVEYDAARVQPLGAVMHDEAYENGVSAFLALPGLLNEVGGFSTSLSPVGSEEHRLFRVPMVAESSGEVAFLPSPADSRPFHDILLYGRDSAVPTADVNYLGTRFFVLPNLLGDIDGDGSVGLADFNQLKSSFGMTNPTTGTDLDNDGAVGLSDFNLLKQNFGRGAGVPVPEPTTLILGLWSAAGALGMGLSVRRFNPR